MRADIARVVEKFTESKSIQEVADAFGCSFGAIRKMLLQEGIVVGKQSKRYHRCKRRVGERNGKS